MNDEYPGLEQFLVKYHESINEAVQELYTDFDGDLGIHRHIIERFGSCSETQYIALKMVDRGVITQSQVPVITTFLENERVQSRIPFIQLYNARFHYNIGRILELIEKDNESAELSRCTALELVQGQVRRMHEGKSISQQVLELYQSAVHYEQWLAVDELVTELYRESLQSILILAERDPYVSPLDNNEIASIIQQIGCEDRYAVEMLERWLKGEFNLAEHPPAPEYTLEQLQPITEKTIDLPDELKRSGENTNGPLR